MVDKNQGGSMEVMFSLKKIFESRWSRLFLKYITSKDRFKNVLEICCRLKSPSTFRELISAKILSFLIYKGAKIFDVKKEEVIETLKKPEYVRGLNLVLKSIDQ